MVERKHSASLILLMRFEKQERTGALQVLARWPHALLVCALLGLNTTVGTQVTPNDLLGTWAGDLRHERESQKFALRFELDEKKSVVLYFYQPEMKFYNLGPGQVELQGKEFKAPPLSFRLTPDKKRMTGVMSVDGNELSFELVRGAVPAPPGPAKFEGLVAQPVWTFKTGGEIWSSPVVDRGVVYIGSNDGSIRALKEESGELVWLRKTGGWVMGRPTIDGEHLYALSDDGFLYKLETKDGTEIWKFDTHGGSVKRVMPNPPESTDYDYLTAAATIAGGTVYIGSADKKLYAVDAGTGQEKWHFDTQDIVRSTPAVSEGTVIFGSRDHNVYAVDAKTGALKWKYDTLREVVSSALVAAHTVYIGSRDSNLFAFDADTGKIKWKFFYWTSWVESSARIRDDILYIGSSDYQQLLAIDAASGKQIWKFDTGGSAWSTPAVTSSLVYIGAVGIPDNGYIDHHGAFFAVDRATGKLVWRYPMSAVPGLRCYGVASSPAVDRGLVFVGGIDGTLYAFKDSN